MSPSTAARPVQGHRRRRARPVGVEIVDDGAGGAHVAKGHGLSGLADRVRASGGTLTVVSPAGGPTTITVELPC